MEFDFDDLYFSELYFSDLIDVIDSHNMNVLDFVHFVYAHNFVDLFLRYQYIFISYINSKNGGSSNG